MINLIVAVNEKFSIGKDNKLLYNISDDLKRFKSITSEGNSYVLMGRNTWDSLPNKPLPNRKNVILSRNKKFTTEYPNVIIEHDINRIINHHLSSGHEDSILNIIGGAEIYALFMPYVDNIYLTMIHDDDEGDAFFPEQELRNFAIVKTEKKYDEKSGLFYSFIDYKKNPL